MLRKIQHLVLGEYDYSTLHRTLELLGIIGFFVLTAALLWQGSSSLDAQVEGWTVYWMIPTITILAYIWADFVSGFFHWMGDTFGSEETPVLGPNFVKPFRDHHVDPEGITRHDFIEVNDNNCILIMIFVGPWYFLPMESYLLAAAMGLFMAVFALSIFMTNQLHKWSHLPERPLWVRVLQASGLVLSPTHHDIHHTAPHDTYFCITSGWCNPLLHKTKFFPRLERIVRAVLRIPKPEQT